MYTWHFFKLVFRGKAGKTLSELLFSLKHGGEGINHGWNHSLENDLKFTVLLTVIDLLYEVVKYTDDELLLLGTGELLELGGLKHETTEDWGDIFLGETIIEIFELNVLNSLNETLGIDLSGELL
jgi:hypothetical protein